LPGGAPPGWGNGVCAYPRSRCRPYRVAGVCAAAEPMIFFQRRRDSDVIMGTTVFLTMSPTLFCPRTLCGDSSPGEKKKVVVGGNRHSAVHVAWCHMKERWGGGVGARRLL